jgi:uncharacterized protein (TIGR02265 family)
MEPRPIHGESDSPYLITHERGPMTRQVRRAVVAEGGEAAWQELLSNVSPACRERFSRPIGYFEWVESPLALEIHQIRQAQVSGELMEERGEQAAREILAGAHSWLLRMATPMLFLQSAPRMLNFYYRGPLGTVQHLSDGHADMLLRAAGHPESFFKEGLCAFLRVALALTGAKQTTVDYMREGVDQHRYLIRWERK